MLYVMIYDLSPSYTAHKINMNCLFAVFSVPLQRVFLNITAEQKKYPERGNGFLSQRHCVLRATE